MKKSLIVYLSVFIVSAAFLCTANYAYAKPGKGEGKGSTEKETAGERIANETADAVADVLTGEDSNKSTGGGTPPGLGKKDKTPPGLEKQDKVPAGWDKGKKEGWDKEAKQDSPIKTFIKGLFEKKEQK